ncbi:MAG TPA: hypothetical protein VK928_13955, partial [Longimicrobiales bacterium]|nr:hypothetical protein [Longimicrobiales bacterium]
MSGPATPVRVIYAKRTSVGAWDVVAKTANIDEADALGLAERLLLGAPPHDAEIVEEAASLAWPDGGRVILRFSPYAWRDPQGRRVFMSDIVWLSDTDFERVRGNPFAILPRCDDVFETLTELPPVQLPAHTASDDASRLGALAPVSDAESLIAAAIRFDRVLVIDDAQRVAKAELFTLLLPPAVRPLFTFQTRAFRVPDVVPRVTMAETFFPSLHEGPWEAVLPDIAHDIPVPLARSLVALAAQPDVLRAAHELRAASALPLDNLRTEVTRVVQLAGVAGQFRRDPAAALQESARRGTTDGVAVLRALAASAPAEAVSTAALALAGNSADHVHATRLV